MNRNEFLQKCSIACLSYTHFVKTLGKISLKNNLSSIHTTVNDYFIDMHCHPSLKLYLWGKKIWKHHPSKKGSNTFNMQVDVRKLLSGNVKGLLAAHYLPEIGLKEHAKRLRRIYPFLKFFAGSFSRKIEKGNSDNFAQVSDMLDRFEKHVEIANKKLGTKKNGKDIIKIARSFREFEDNINAGIVSVAQTIEGSHALGRNMGNDSAAHYLTNLDLLFERGICLMTIAHFFENDCCFPVEGMPPWNKSGLKFYWKYNPETDNKPLSPIGRSIVTRMLEKGMIVDITHLTPFARNEVFQINERFNRPIIFTHTGVQNLFAGPAEFDHFKFYCVSDEEIEKIKNCRGVIGLIFMTYFLVGQDTHMTQTNTRQVENGIDALIETIQYIREKTGSYENIALGSDFDNLGNAPADLKDPSYFPLLLERVKKIPSIKEEEVEMITRGNALRVLRDGWKR